MIVALVLTAASGEAQNTLPFPPLVFGSIAFGFFLLLLAITYAFRSVGNRH